MSARGPQPSQLDHGPPLRCRLLGRLLLCDGGITQRLRGAALGRVTQRGKTVVCRGGEWWAAPYILGTMRWGWGSALLAAIALAVIQSAVPIAANANNRAGRPLRLILSHHSLRP